jgi:hypothetical protein
MYSAMLRENSLIYEGNKKGLRYVVYKPFQATKVTCDVVIIDVS